MTHDAKKSHKITTDGALCDLPGGCSETDFTLLDSRHFRDSQHQENLTLLRQRTGDKGVMAILWKT